MIFVFGSNLAGRHGAGAALYALKNHGAIYGQGEGRQGNSYAIATKNEKLQTLPLWHIKGNIEAFFIHAELNPSEQFQVTAIGTGLAGYQHSDIAPMFKYAPTNCVLPEEWKEYVK